MEKLCQRIWGLQVGNNTSAIQDRSNRSFINHDHSGRTLRASFLDLCQAAADPQTIHCFRERQGKAITSMLTKQVPSPGRDGLLRPAAKRPQI